MQARRLKWVRHELTALVGKAAVERVLADPHYRPWWMEGLTAVAPGFDHLPPHRRLVGSPRRAWTVWRKPGRLTIRSGSPPHWARGQLRTMAEGPSPTCSPAWPRVPVLRPLGDAEVLDEDAEEDA